MTSLDDVLAVVPEVHERYRELVAELWAPDRIDPRLLELCRIRLAQLLGDASGATFFDHQPEQFAAFNRLYGTLWSRGRLDQVTKEVGRLRNAFVVDCRL